MPFTAAQIASQLRGEVIGNPQTPLTGLAPAENAKPGDLTFAETDDFFAAAEKSAAAAIIVGGERTSTTGKTLIRVKNPRLAFAKVLALFMPEPALPPGVHASAAVAASAQIDPSAHIGPHCVIGEHVRIGAGTALLGGNHIGDKCVLGDSVKLFPNVVLYPRSQLGNRVRIHAGTVIGSDGFGYVLEDGAHFKIPQVGNVIIADDVEIGANTAVDRGALGPTIIGKGTKIDNLVQLAHNVQTGEHCILISQAAIAGSTKIGNYVIIAGQAGLTGHIKIGDRVTIAGQSGVMRDVPDGQTLWGTPAQPDKQTKRQLLAMQRLPELLKRVAALEKLAGIEPPERPS